MKYEVVFENGDSFIMKLSVSDAIEFEKNPNVVSIKKKES